MKRLLQRCYFSEKGFTKIETLVVVLIVVFLACVVALNVVTLTDEVRASSYGFELNNVQAALKAMLVESATGQLDADIIITDSMTLITVNNGDKRLSDYMYGLDANGKIKTGCMYAFNKYGTVSQIRP